MTVLEAATRLRVDRNITDEEVVRRVLGGETDLFEIIMRRYNQRLYRATRSILGSDAEAEQVMQDAYVSAYTHLAQFAGRARFSTWLTKIAVYAALAHLRQRGKLVDLESIPESERERSTMFASREGDPERQLLDRELKGVLEDAVESLPEYYRSVLVMRDVEGMDTLETAECLGLTEETVKTRLHRARAMVRRTLAANSASALPGSFQFHLSRCDRVVAGVFARIRTLSALSRSTDS